MKLTKRKHIALYEDYLLLGTLYLLSTHAHMANCSIHTRIVAILRQFDKKIAFLKTCILRLPNF
jgi:hypothetical protein